MADAFTLQSDWKKDDLKWRQGQLQDGEEITGLGTQPYHNVDLDTMHNDLYKGYYFTPDDFLDDILRIQANAEVNAILEHDVEAPVKAGQMVNHVKVMIDQTFDEAFRGECVKMSQRIEEWEKNAPEGQKKKSKKGKSKAPPPSGDLIAVAQAAAAAGGGARLVPRLQNLVEGENGDLEEDNEAERALKRARFEGEEEMPGGEQEQ